MQTLERAPATTTMRTGRGILEPFDHPGVARPILQAFVTLRAIVTVIPIVAGIDIFVHYLTNWDNYLAVQVAGVSGHSIMIGVAVASIVSGLLAAFAPRIGGYVTCLLFWVYAANFIVGKGGYDIAMLDIGLAFCGLALARMAKGVRMATGASRVTTAPVVRG